MNRTNTLQLNTVMSKLACLALASTLMAAGGPLSPPNTATVTAGHWCGNCLPPSIQGQPNLAISWFDGNFPFGGSYSEPFLDTSATSYATAVGGGAPEVTASADGPSGKSVLANADEVFYFMVSDPNASTATVTMSGLLDTTFSGPADGGFGTTFIGDSDTQARLIAYPNGPFNSFGSYTAALYSACAGYDACSSYSSTPVASGSHPFSTDLVLQTNTVYEGEIFASVNADADQDGKSSASLNFTVGPSCTGCSVELFTTPEPSTRLTGAFFLLAGLATLRLRKRWRTV
jgi:hypothetical protein